MFNRVLISGATALGLSIALSGCTPPMPPEVLAALAEQTYTCESGSGTLAVPQAVADLGPMWQDSLIGACSDMSLDLSSEGQPADLELSAIGTFSAECKPFATVPFALDAAVLAANMPELGELYLTPQLAEQILNGDITNWDDPKLVEANPDYDLPAMPITVEANTQANTLDAFASWMTRLGGHDFKHSLVIAGDPVTDADAAGLAEGSVALMPYSQSSQAMLLNATILTNGNKADSAVPADMESIASAGTQFTAKQANGLVTATLKPEAKPIAPDGLDVAPLPYQATYINYLALCGEDTLVKRALARFLLRQDSQGMLGASNMLNIAESVRVISLDAVSKGLTLPSVDPADFEQ